MEAVRLGRILGAVARQVRLAPARVRLVWEVLRDGPVPPRPVKPEPTEWDRRAASTRGSGERPT